MERRKRRRREIAGVAKKGETSRLRVKPDVDLHVFSAEIYEEISRGEIWTVHSRIWMLGYIRIQQASQRVCRCIGQLVIC